MSERFQRLLPDIYWLAGLLEGEGCFSFSKAHGYLHATITLNMTDKDVVERAISIVDELVGGEILYGPYYRKEEDWNPLWRCRVNGSKAVYLMRLIYPTMGQRRQKRIKEILETVAKERVRAKEAKAKATRLYWERYRLERAWHERRATT